MELRVLVEQTQRKLLVEQLQLELKILFIELIVKYFEEQHFLQVVYAGREVLLARVLREIHQAQAEAAVRAQV